MGLGHVSPRPLREAGEGDDLPRREHRGAGAHHPDLSDRSALGRFGETVAAAFLAGRGASVVARNLSVGRGEIDLLVRFGHRYVAVEVKTVGSGAVAGDPIERITPGKLARVRALAGALAHRYGRVRVDFVGVRVGETGVTVNWRQDVA